MSKPDCEEAVILRWVAAMASAYLKPTGEDASVSVDDLDATITATEDRIKVLTHDRYVDGKVDAGAYDAAYTTLSATLDSARETPLMQRLQRPLEALLCPSAIRTPLILDGGTRPASQSGAQRLLQPSGPLPSTLWLGAVAGGSTPTGSASLGRTPPMTDSLTIPTP